MINYLDLFSGIGGFHQGLVEAGVEIDKCYFSEIEKNAIKVYKKHFPESIELGDVSRINGKSLGEINLITFGFPCQDLSIAGKRKGLQGSRSGLFFEATRLIRECRPDVFIFENVKGLLSSNNGKDFEVVLREIADIGLYECEWQLLNTSWFLPQNRERIYFIGHLAEAGRGGQKVFPIGEIDSDFTGIQRQAREERQGVQGKFPDGERNKVCSQNRGGHKDDLVCVSRERERERESNCETIRPKITRKLNKAQNVSDINRVGDGRPKAVGNGMIPQAYRVGSVKGNAVTLSGLGGGAGAKTGLYEIKD
jgi:DNA-cytosine methyltransferase